MRARSAIGSYDTDVESSPLGPSTPADPPSDGVDLDPRSAIPLAIAVAIFVIAVWFIRSIPRTLSAFALATLFALALNPLVEALKRRTGWHRRTAAGAVLVMAALVITVVVALVTVPTIREVREFNKQIPQTVKDLGRLPIVGPRLREANASEKVQQWLNDVPKHLSTNSKPIENAAGAIADGVAAALFTILLAITIVLDGEFLVGGVRRLVPARRRAEETAVHDPSDGVEQRVGVELELARHQEVREPLQQRHERGDRGDVPACPGVAHTRTERGRDIGERDHAQPARLAILDVALHPRAQHRSEPGVGREEGLEEPA